MMTQAEREVAMKAMDIWNSYQEAAYADAEFDGGEFSGPAASVGQELKEIRQQHDCGCEVCSTVSAVCPASASSYAMEILRLRNQLACVGTADRAADKAIAELAEKHGYTFDQVSDWVVELSMEESA